MSLALINTCPPQFSFSQPQDLISSLFISTHIGLNVPGMSTSSHAFIIFLILLLFVLITRSLTYLGR